MKVHALIAALTKIDQDADVIWAPENGERVPVEGGIPALGPKGPVLLLAPIALPDVGGF